MVELISRKTAANTAATLFDNDSAPEAPPALSRLQLLDRILVINGTATKAYLETFSDLALARYLAHLETIDSPRGGRWERPGDSPAILVRETAC